MMAQTEPVDVVAEQHGSSGLFTGKRFFVLQRVPDRLKLIDRIRSAGGSVVSLERQANFMIADDSRIDCPPNSTSFRFIYDTLDQDRSIDPDDYRCTSSTGAARPASSSLVQRKATRRDYTDEDDRILLAHLRERARAGKPILGNVPYKELETKVGRHTWQSWQSRYTKTLIHRTSVNDLMGIDEPSPAPSTTRTDYTAEDDRLLLVHLREIAKAGGAIQGTVPYKKLEATVGRHTWQSWQGRYVKTLVRKISVNDLKTMDEASFAAIVDEAVDASSAAQSPIHSTTLQPDAVVTDAAPHSEAMGESYLKLSPRQRELLVLLQDRRPTDSSNKRFSKHDILHLVHNVKDIPKITHHGWRTAWEAWAEVNHFKHTSQDWMDLYVNHVLPVLTQQSWNHALEDASPRKVATAPSKQLADSTAQSSPQPARRGSLNLKRKLLTTPTKQSPHNKRQALSQEQRSRVDAQSQRFRNERPTQTQQTSDASDIDEAQPEAVTAVPVSVAQREKLEMRFDQALQKKHIEENFNSVAAMKVTPPTHMLTAANLATQTRQQSRTLSHKSPLSAVARSSGIASQVPNSPAVQTANTRGDVRPARSAEKRNLENIQPSQDKQTDLLNRSMLHAPKASRASNRDINSQPTSLEPRSGTDASGALFLSQNSSAAHQLSNESGQSFDSALLGTAANMRDEQNGLEAPTLDPFELDLSIPSPYKPTQAERSARTSGASSTSLSLLQEAEKFADFEEESEEEGVGQAAQQHTMDTQALFNAKTQQLDDSFPDPDHVDANISVSIEDNDEPSTYAQHNHRLADPSVDDDAESVDGDAIEAFYDEFSNKGYSEEDIITALEMTSNRPELAEFVLLLRRAGEPIPSDVPGIWTAAEDRMAQGGDSLHLRALDEKHGDGAYLIRLRFLEDLRRDSQEE